MQTSLSDSPMNQTKIQAEKSVSLAPVKQYRSIWLSLCKRLPSLIVFTCLGGLLYWGHTYGWSLPKFSELLGQSSENKDDWCSEHGVPESICVECNSELLPKLKKFGWCKQHGVHECPLCHPEVAQLSKKPLVTPEDLERSKKALAFSERVSNDNKCTKHERRIQFVSLEAVEKAGVQVDPVWTGPMAEFVTAPGEINYDPTRTARLSSRVPGAVFRALKKMGDSVRKGEIVALIDASEVGKAKAEFLQAIASERLKKAIHESLSSATISDVISRRSVTEAAANLSEARIRVASARQMLINLGLPIEIESLAHVSEEQLPDYLRFLGLPKNITQELDPKSTSGNLLPLLAPFDGVITSRDVVEGEVVESGKSLFVVIDPSWMWIILSLRLEDAQRVSVGNVMRFQPDGASVESLGKITWIGTEADHQTRTVKIRAELNNSNHQLRASTFGLGRVILREEPKAIIVPHEAVHSEGCCRIVFVRDKNFLNEDAPKVFHVRTVRVGAKDERNTEIIAGVLPGEIVAVKGSAALRAELLRGDLGEG